jgi:hypothetical protein
MAKSNTGTGPRSNENPPPTRPDYESFHVTASKAVSERVVSALREAGVRFNETVWHEIGVPEYVIEVHREDLDKAGEAFWKDLGPAKTVTSGGTDPGAAS